ncbi:sigma-70 family RNA polymerase sigma factor [Streptomyces sp. 15-116A]|uniref:sigma-70 family RNA polymerase sigma factor n=1 Tax=Streptomyces sp. 15-116A TaxID=2259035 RepID=UPI0021B26D3D|nr:sigma-70 family RNA polymerase sigma factor [Streptomyces sp. 15-116A]MCT7351030.1 sigma-70 family RNA polymerase sigma factor [Streptomyces sp. 15-116A]
MAHRSDVGGGEAVAGLRAALGELLSGLRQAAVGGVVPEHVFAEGVRALALGDAERERLRHELARLGLPVGESHVHVGDDRQGGEKVVRRCEENVSSRLVSVRALLARYADADGYVTSRVLEGVTRLAGLTAREAEQLRAGALVRAEAAQAVDAPALEPEPEPEGGAGDEGGEDAHGDLAPALAAAHAVLDADRFERSPGNRLLSAQAEVGLAVLVRGGAEHIGREPDDDELKALPPGDLRIRARDCLVLHNQRLVHSVVRPYLDQGLDYDDLLQHGFLGLLRATRKFDPTKGFKFSTYATWWIRQSITRAIADEGALIRIPVHMHEQMRKVVRAERSLAAEGRPATVADVAVRCDMTLQKVEEIRRLTRRTDSLDRVIGDGSTLADFVGHLHALPSVEKQVLDALHVEAALDVVDTFGARERRILVRRLGLDGDEPSTLDELGREFGVTRERIRQIEVKARPELRERLRTAGLVDVDLDALCAEAERAADKAAEAVRAARIARATHGARTARARHALRRARAQRLAAAAGEHKQVPETPGPAAGAREVANPLTAEAESVAAQVDGEHAGVEGDVAGERLAVGGGTARGEDAGGAGDATAGNDAEVEGGAAAGDNAAVSRDAGAAARTVSERDAAPEAVAADEQDSAAVAAFGTEVVAAGEAGRGAGQKADADTVAGTGMDGGGGAGAAVAVFGAEVVAAGEAGGGAGQKADADTVADTGTEGDAGAGAARVAGTGTGSSAEIGPDAASPTAGADWDRALRMAEAPVEQDAWLAAYALAALGHQGLVALLGRPAADVVRDASAGGHLSRDVLTALDVLRRVVDHLAQTGQRPEDLLDRPAECLRGGTLRAYLTERPLVLRESRLAARDALREFIAAAAEKEAVPVDEEAAPVTDLRGEYEVREARLREEFEQRLAEQRQSAGQELAAWEDVLLTRMDTMVLRREGRIRAQSVQRIAQLKAQHHEAYQEALRRAGAAEEVLRQAERHRDRTEALELRLRQYREDTEARITDLETQLWQARAALTQRDRADEDVLRRQREAAEARVAALEERLRETEAALARQEQAVAAARLRAEHTEQQAAQRIAQTEHDAWVRITELQQQLAETQQRLAAAKAAAESRSSFRDRWRRS